MKKFQPLFTFVLGIIVAYSAGTLLVTQTRDDSYLHVHDGHEHDDEVHVHSDFIVFLGGEQLDLSADKYMSASDQVLHTNVHLHDNTGHIIHRHADAITLADFFGSLGFTLTDNCITTATSNEYCSTEDDQLLLFINGDATTTIASYVNQEGDRLLLYYGDPSDPITDELNNSITDESCIYSGTCPERGTAPPESCGLTCEL